MKRLASYLRFKQLFAHNCHNLTQGKTFFEDHAFFGSLYEQAQSDYDSIIERMLGLEPDKECDLVGITEQATEYLCKAKVDFKNPELCLRMLIKITEEIIKKIEVMTRQEDMSQGVIQLLGDIANREEASLYKIHQRLKP